MASTPNTSTSPITTFPEQTTGTTSEAGLDTSSTSEPDTTSTGQSTGSAAECADGVVADGEVCFGAPVSMNVGKSLMDLVVLDVDQDGHLDILSVNPTAMNPLLLWWSGGGDGTFGEVQQQPTYGSPSAILVTDVNHDKIEDIVLTDTDENGVRVHVNVDGQLINFQQIYASGPVPIGIAKGDFNADNLEDLVVTHDAGSTIGVLRGLAFGYKQPPASYEIAPTGFGIVTGDLNGDGNLDIISVSIEGWTDVFLGDGLGGFDPFGMSVALGTPYQLGLLDATGDGAVDLLCLAGGELYISPGDGAGGLGEAIVHPEIYKPSAFVIADFTHDGTLDMAIGSWDADPIAIFPGSDTGLGPPLGVVALASRRMVAGDFNEDGVLDLALIFGAFGNDSVVVLSSAP